MKRDELTAQVTLRVHDGAFRRIDCENHEGHEYESIAWPMIPVVEFAAGSGDFSVILPRKRGAPGGVDFKPASRFRPVPGGNCVWRPLEGKEVRRLMPAATFSCTDNEIDFLRFGLPTPEAA